MSFAITILRKCFMVLPLLARVTAAGGGKRFLGTRDRHAGLSSPRGPADLLVELERLNNVSSFNHTEVTASKVDELEEALLPLYKIAPKDESGYLDAKAARYILHRLFSQRYGWFVNGIELHGGLQRDASKVGDALKQGGRFSLQQLARFAATLETLVHGENIERLNKAFAWMKVKKDLPMNSKKLTDALVGYMMIFLEHVHVQGSSFKEALEYVQTTIPSWQSTIDFAKSFQDAAERDIKDIESRTVWDVAVHIVGQIGEKYGHWQNTDCLDMKSDLMKIATPGTGRVPLASFWAPLLNGDRWMFTESLPYLEQLGAVEGSEAPNHSVVIPNYMYSAGNCLASSKYYDVCCINECDTILSKLEAEIAAPSAFPQQIVGVIQQISSSNVAAPRELPASLVQRLGDVAVHHGGKVPLHGRLFFQFMHHAFPFECPYPLASLSEEVEVSDAWIKRQTPSARATQETVTEYCKAAEESEFHPMTSARDIPWTDEEDLFMQTMRKDEEPRVSMVVPLLGSVMALGALIYKLRKQIAKAFGYNDKVIQSYCL